MVDRDRIDQLFTFILATAAQCGEYRGLELGPIHFVKYAYLADLAFAERHQGETFSGTEWQFFHFGPWSGAVLDLLEPSLTRVGATVRHFSSKYSDDHVRYGLDRSDAEALSRRLERELPGEVTYAVSRAVQEHGSDTADLLRHVYLTAPMLAAKPQQFLDFRTVVRSADHEPHFEPMQPAQLSAKERRRRRGLLEEARVEIQKRLSGSAARRVAPDPAPRYDDVFFEGSAMLDRTAGEHVGASQGEVQFDDSIWLSSQRRDPDVS